MKFSVDQKELSQAISLVSRAISKRPSRPILGYIKVVAHGGTISLTGFDEAIALEVRAPCTVEREGALCLPAQLWSDIVSRLPPELVTVFVSDDPSNAIVACGRSITYQVRGLLVEDYPALPTVEGESFPVLAQVLLDGLAGTVPVCSADASKQILQGVHWLVQGELLEFAATDGHHMTLSQKNADADLQQVEITVPGKALEILARMLGQVDAADAVQVALDETQARFEVGDQTLIARLLEGQYPNYRQLIPASYAYTADLPRRPLLAALKRLAPMAAQKNNIIKLQFNGAVLHITCDAKELGSGAEMVPLDLPVGFAEAIAFNLNYLAEALETIDGDTVAMKFNTPLKPVVFEAIEGGQLNLVMPIQVRG